MRIEQIEIGELARQQRRIGKTDIFVVGRDPRHRHRAFGELRDAVAADVVGRDHGLALSDQHAQPDIVAFRTLGFLDAAVAHFDALRNAAHRDRIGRIRAGAFRRLDQPLRQRRERRLVEQIGGRGSKRSGEAVDGEEITNKIPDIEASADADREPHQMCLIHGDFKHFTAANAKQFRHCRKVSSIM